jgi:hypothetical protein
MSALYVGALGGVPEKENVRVPRFDGDETSHVTADRALLAYALEGKAYVSTICLEAPIEDAAPKLGVHGGIVVGETISERHPIFSIAFAPEVTNESKFCHLHCY